MAEPGILRNYLVRLTRSFGVAATSARLTALHPNRERISRTSTKSRQRPKLVRPPGYEKQLYCAGTPERWSSPPRDRPFSTKQFDVTLMKLSASNHFLEGRRRQTTAN